MLITSVVAEREHVARHDTPCCYPWNCQTTHAAQNGTQFRSPAFFVSGNMMPDKTKPKFLNQRFYRKQIPRVIKPIFFTSVCYRNACRAKCKPMLLTIAFSKTSAARNQKTVYNTRVHSRHMLRDMQTHLLCTVAFSKTNVPRKTNPLFC